MTMTVSSDADPKAEGSPRDEPAARCRRAAIDVGTHSVRLLIVEAERAGEGLAASSRGKGEAFPPWREVYRRQEITRLGEGWQPGQPLDPQARRRTTAALHSFLADLERWQVADVHAVATGVVREASDGRHWVAQLREDLGLPVRIVTGEEEGELAFRGVLAGLRGHRHRAGTGHLLVLDVGGGTTEGVWGSVEPEPRILRRVSLPLGAVRLTQRFLTSDPPTDEEWDRLQKHIPPILEAGMGASPETGCLRPLREPVEGRAQVPRVVGVGGTATSLAAVDQGLAVYRRAKVHGYRLEVAAIARWAEELRRMPLAVRQQVPGLQPQRAAVLPAGAAILAAALAVIGAKSLMVSDFDLLEGILTTIDP